MRAPCETHTGGQKEAGNCSGGPARRRPAQRSFLHQLPTAGNKRIKMLVCRKASADPPTSPLFARYPTCTSTKRHRSRRLFGCSAVRLLGCSAARLLGCSAAQLLSCSGCPSPPLSASACDRSQYRRFGCRRAAKLRALTCGGCLNGEPSARSEFDRTPVLAVIAGCPERFATRSFRGTLDVGQIFRRGETRPAAACNAHQHQ